MPGVEGAGIYIGCFYLKTEYFLAMCRFGYYFDGFDASFSFVPPSAESNLRSIRTIERIFLASHRGITDLFHGFSSGRTDGRRISG